MSLEQQWIINSVEDADITASSEFNDKHAANLARLHSKQGNANWSAKKNNTEQWIQVDLKSQQTVCEVAVQGRFNKPQWVIKYNLLLSKDLTNWVTFENIAGVTDKDTVSYFKLPKPNDCQYVRFIPKEWNGHISMRIDVAIAKQSTSPITVETPQQITSSELDITKLEIENLKAEIEKKKLELELAKLSSNLNYYTNNNNQKTELQNDLNTVTSNDLLISKFEDEFDELLVESIYWIYKNNVASPEILQAHLFIGVNRAKRIIQSLIERFGFETLDDDDNQLLLPYLDSVILKLEQFGLDINPFFTMINNFSRIKTQDESEKQQEIIEKFNNLRSEKKYNQIVIIYKGTSNDDGAVDMRLFSSDYTFDEILEMGQITQKIIDLDLINNPQIINDYLWALFQNDGTETEAFDEVKNYLEKFPNNQNMLDTAGYIAKYLGANNSNINLLNEALYYFNKSNNIESIKEVNVKISDIKNQNIENQLEAEKNEQYLEEALQRQKEEELEEERKREEKRQKQEAYNRRIGTNTFSASTLRGGGLMFKENITVNDDEVVWEQSKGILSGTNRIKIPMKNITDISYEGSFSDGYTIVIRSKGSGKITGTHFSKTDVHNIESLINKVQSYL